MIDEDHRPDRAHELGDPQAHIGRAIDDGRTRIGCVDLGEIVEARRHDDALGTFTQFDPPPVIDRLDPALERNALGPEWIAFGATIGGYCLARADDRGISRAAAEVALQGLFDCRLAWIGIAHPQPIEAHHEAGRTEAALRTVVVHHGLLHRMQIAILAAQVLHRHHMGTVQAADKTDAGGDRVIDDFVIHEPADQHRAGAAIALGAAFLGAAQALLQSQPVEQGRIRPDLREADFLVIEDEADGACLFGHAQLPR